MQDNLESRTALTETIHIIAEDIENNKEYEVEVQTESFVQYILFLLNQYQPGVEYSYFIRNDKYVIYKKMSKNGLFSALLTVFIVVTLMVGILFLTQKSTLVNF